jgi:hypothetical protein
MANILRIAQSIKNTIKYPQMTRINPKCYIEIWSNGAYTIAGRYALEMDSLSYQLSATVERGLYTVALFLIKPQSTTLAERLEARKVNNNLNQ